MEGKKILIFVHLVCLNVSSYHSTVTRAKTKLIVIIVGERLVGSIKEAA